MIRKTMLAALLGLLLNACAGSPTEESTGQYVDDSAITTKVKSSLFADPGTSGLSISVETYKGTVQLSGFVHTEAERNRAGAIARSVPGVVSVKNDLHLR